MANLLINSDFRYMLTSEKPFGYVDDGGGGTISQITTGLPTGFDYGIKIEAVSGTWVKQAAESHNSVLEKLRGKQVTVSAWVKCDTADKANVQIYNGTTDTKTFHDGDNTWQRISATATIDSDADIVHWAVVVSGSETGYYTGAMMEIGGTMSDYEPSDLDYLVDCMVIGGKLSF